MNEKEILIVEDETDLAGMIEKYLRKEGYSVVTIGKGGKARDYLKEHLPSLLILDLMLPEVDGLEILSQLRRVSTIPVIIISAKESEFDSVLGLKLGADDYVTKPFSLKELVVRVETLFRRIHYETEIKEKKPRIIGSLSLNPLSREIKKNGLNVELTAKEFDLFLFFVEHPRQVFSKDHLYEQVWGFDQYGDTNTVAVHVQKLREKLGDDSRITTVWGVGYRFDGDIR